MGGRSRLEVADRRYRGLEGIEERALVAAIVAVVFDYLRYHGRFVVACKILGRVQLGGNRLEGQTIDPEQLERPFRIIVYGGNESGFYRA